MRERNLEEHRRNRPGPIPSTVLLPAATCVRPLNGNVVRVCTKRRGKSVQPHASWMDRAQRFKLWAFACKRSISSWSEHLSATLVWLSSSASGTRSRPTRCTTLPSPFPVFEKLRGIEHVMTHSTARALDIPSDSMLIGYGSTPRWRVCTQGRQFDRRRRVWSIVTYEHLSSPSSAPDSRRVLFYFHSLCSNFPN